MKASLFFLFLFFGFAALSAQQYVIGKVISEFGNQLPFVTVLNVQTDTQVQTDQEGNFIIPAQPKQELRFVKKGYDRVTKMVTSEDFSKNLAVTLTKLAIEIAEVEITFKPTGNLKKDSKKFDENPKIAQLNANMNNYMRTKPTETFSTLKTPSTISFGPNYSAGQVNLFSVGNGGGGIIGGIYGIVKKSVGPKKTKANFSEQQAFYRRVKEEVNMDYFIEYGLEEHQLDAFIIYADRTYQLAKNFRKDFDAVKILGFLRAAFQEYIKTDPVSS